MSALYPWITELTSGGSTLLRTLQAVYCNNQSEGGGSGVLQGVTAPSTNNDNHANSGELPFLYFFPC